MTAQTTPLPAATPVGYPRIGPGRELKKAEEAYWAGRIDHAEFARRTRELRRATRARLAELGLSAAAAAPESFSLYDQVLDAALAVGLVPDRFASVIGADGTIDDDGLLRARPRHCRAAAAGDDQVVRHQLPLPGSRDRPGHGRPASRLRPRVVACSANRSRTAPAPAPCWSAR